MQAVLLREKAVGAAAWVAWHPMRLMTVPPARTPAGAVTMADVTRAVAPSAGPERIEAGALPAVPVPGGAGLVARQYLPGVLSPLKDLLPHCFAVESLPRTDAQLWTITYVVLAAMP